MIIFSRFLNFLMKKIVNPNQGGARESGKLYRWRKRSPKSPRSSSYCRIPQKAARWGSWMTNSKLTTFHKMTSNNNYILGSPGSWRPPWSRTDRSPWKNEGGSGMERAAPWKRTAPPCDQQGVSTKSSWKGMKKIIKKFGFKSFFLDQWTRRVRAPPEGARPGLRPYDQRIE